MKSDKPLYTRSQADLHKSKNEIAVEFTPSFNDGLVGLLEGFFWRHSDKHWILVNQNTACAMLLHRTIQLGLKPDLWVTDTYTRFESEYMKLHYPDNHDFNTSRNAKQYAYDLTLQEIIKRYGGEGR
jgi:hypothetical protein